MGQLVQKHMGDPNSSLHSSAAERAEDFVRVAIGKQPDIVTIGRSAYRERRKKNLTTLSSLLECIKFLGKQGIALREHCLQDGSNPGNFLALVDFRTHTDPVLREHLDNCSRNAQYLSPQIQNELIEVCGEEIRKSLVNDCQRAQYFSVLADETTDISTKEQLSICVRFIDTSNGQVRIREEFLGFVLATSTTRESLASLILGSLEKWGVDVNFLRGQGYDGAANMSGRFKGVQAIVQKQIPSAVYVHCRAHSLNLAIVHSSRNAHVRNMFGTVQEVAVFFGESAKRHHLFQEIDKANTQTGLPGRSRLQKLCETRWSSRADALTTIKAKWKSVLDSLSSLVDDGDAKAYSLLRSLQSFDLTVSLVVVEHFLSYTSALSKALQREDTDLLTALDEAWVILQSIKGDRNDAFFTELYAEQRTCPGWWNH